MFHFSREKSMVLVLLHGAHQRQHRENQERRKKGGSKIGGKKIDWEHSTVLNDCRQTTVLFTMQCYLNNKMKNQSAENSCAMLSIRLNYIFIRYYTLQNNKYNSNNYSRKNIQRYNFSPFHSTECRHLITVRFINMQPVIHSFGCVALDSLGTAATAPLMLAYTRLQNHPPSYS